MTSSKDVAVRDTYPCLLCVLVLKLSTCTFRAFWWTLVFGSSMILRYLHCFTYQPVLYPLCQSDALSRLLNLTHPNLLAFEYPNRFPSITSSWFQSITVLLLTGEPLLLPHPYSFIIVMSFDPDIPKIYRYTLIFTPTSPFFFGTNVILLPFSPRFRR